MKLWMHLGGLLSTQEVIVALAYRLVQLLRFYLPRTCRNRGAFLGHAQ